MRPLHTTASWLLAAVLSTASVGLAADKAAKPSDDENPNPKLKFDQKKGGDKDAELMARLDSLERQVQELTVLMKQRQQFTEKKGDFGKDFEGKKPGSEKFVEKGTPKEFPEGKKPDKFAEKGNPKEIPEGKKPGPDKFVEKGTPKEFPEGKKPGPDKFVEKGAADSGKKFAAEKPDGSVIKGKPEKGEQNFGKGQGQIVRGPNGELLVPLSSLPPELQDQLLARAKGQKQDGQKGDFKQPKKGANVDDQPQPKGK